MAVMSPSVMLRNSPPFLPITESLIKAADDLAARGSLVTADTGVVVSSWRDRLNRPIWLVPLAAFVVGIVPTLSLPWFVWLFAWALWGYCVFARVLFRRCFVISNTRLDNALSAFICDAGLCSRDVNDKGLHDDSIRLFYRDDYGAGTLSIEAFDDVKYHSQVSRLDDLGLAAVIGAPLDSKTVGVSSVVYTFRTKPDARIQALDLLAPSAPPFSGVPDSVPLTGSLAWRFAKLPHMLIAGGTGGGKSTFIYYLLIEFMRLGDANGGAADVYICDPKNAELASLSCVFGSDHVGVSAGQIAGVVRRCREEMDRRYEYMQDPERFHFGASAFDYGLNPVFLVFDEVAAFKAAADKKTFAEVWENLTQLVLKARAANVFVILAMQQPRADTISTDIRDNLGARVTLGNLSAEGYRMAFGSCDGFKPQSIAERGTGYIMLDGWDAPKPFKAPFADYSRVDYPEELKRLYIAAQRRNGVSADTADKDGTAESVSD